jgi:hypothetical protein
MVRQGKGAIAPSCHRFTINKASRASLWWRGKTRRWQRQANAGADFLYAYSEYTKELCCSAPPSIRKHSEARDRLPLIASQFIVVARGKTRRWQRQANAGADFMCVANTKEQCCSAAFDLKTFRGARSLTANYVTVYCGGARENSALATTG